MRHVGVCPPANLLVESTAPQAPHSGGTRALRMVFRYPARGQMLVDPRFERRRKSLWLRQASTGRALCARCMPAGCQMRACTPPSSRANADQHPSRLRLAPLTGAAGTIPFGRTPAVRPARDVRRLCLSPRAWCFPVSGLSGAHLQVRERLLGAVSPPMRCTSAGCRVSRAGRLYSAGNLATPQQSVGEVRRDKSGAVLPRVARHVRRRMK